LRQFELPLFPIVALLVLLVLLVFVPVWTPVT
jgi:hypothetical protein